MIPALSRKTITVAREVDRIYWRPLPFLRKPVYEFSKTAAWLPWAIYERARSNCGTSKSGLPLKLTPCSAASPSRILHGVSGFACCCALIVCSR